MGIATLVRLRGATAPFVRTSSVEGRRSRVNRLLLGRARSHELDSGPESDLGLDDGPQVSPFEQDGVAGAVRNNNVLLHLIGLSCGLEICGPLFWSTVVS